MNARAAAGGPIIRLKISAVPTTGTVIVVASATSTRKQSSITNGVDPPCLGGLGRSTEPAAAAATAIASASRHAAVRRDRRPDSLWLIPSTSPNSSESTLGAVLDAEAEEQRAEPEHEDERQRGRDVVPPAAAEQPDPERAAEREHPEAEQRVDADQAGAGGAGERAVRDRVGDERRASHDDEEADGAADDRDERRDDPGVCHEAAEHRFSSGGAGSTSPDPR